MQRFWSIAATLTALTLGSPPDVAWAQSAPDDNEIAAAQTNTQLAAVTKQVMAGSLDAETIAHLAELNPNSYVHFVQSYLGQAGLFTGTPNGRLDSRTIKAISGFCAANGFGDICAAGPLTADATRKVAETIAGAVAAKAAEERRAAEAQKAAADAAKAAADAEAAAAKAAEEQKAADAKAAAEAEAAAAETAKAAAEANAASSIRIPFADGAVGSPGTLPTGWTGEVPAGLTLDVVAIDENSITLHLHGTNVDAKWVHVFMTERKTVKTSADEPWSFSAEASYTEAVSGGPAPSLWVMGRSLETQPSGAVGNVDLPASGGPAKVAFSGIASKDSVYVQPFLHIPLLPGAASDMTITVSNVVLTKG